MFEPQKYNNIGKAPLKIIPSFAPQGEQIALKLYF
jgi:hypothetical protein